MDSPGEDSVRGRLNLRCGDKGDLYLGSQRLIKEVSAVGQPVDDELLTGKDGDNGVFWFLLGDVKPSWTANSC